MPLRMFFSFQGISQIIFHTTRGWISSLPSMHCGRVQLSLPALMQLVTCSVAVTQLKVDLKAKVGHMLVQVTHHFLMKTAGWFGHNFNLSQDLKLTHTMLATPLNMTLPLPQSTLIKIDTSMTLPFTTHNKYHIESCTAIAVEMEKYLVGPMPIQQFLDDFFPVKKLPHLSSSNIPWFKHGNYNTTIQDKTEINMYNHFVSFSYLITRLLKPFARTTRMGLNPTVSKWEQTSTK